MSWGVGEMEIGEILQDQGAKLIWKGVLASVDKDFLPLLIQENLNSLFRGCREREQLPLEQR